MAIDKFKLPREDWYDTVRIDPDTGEIVGRIYKDALIENFNAIEAQLNELAALKGYNVDIPDLSNFDFDDTTLESDENRIVNVQSFLKIMSIQGFPIECTFTGNVCKRLLYFDNLNKPKVLTDVKVSGLDENTNKYVLLDYVKNELKASSTIGAENTTFIGMYNKGEVYCLNHKDLANINVLSILSNMSEDIRSFGTLEGHCLPQNKVGAGGRAYASWYRESKGPKPITINAVTDYGRRENR